MDKRSIYKPINPLLFLPCDLDEFRDPKKKVAALAACDVPEKLSAQDEISVSSIISAILRPIESSAEQYRECNWDINAKHLMPEKQAIVFQEQLFISTLQNTNCKLSEDRKAFLEKELEQIGKFCLNVEEAFDGFVVYSSSKMRKGKALTECGHQLKGKYDHKFLLICEKRMEYDRIDHARVEKILELRNHADQQLTAIRETKINDESKKFKAIIDIKNQDYVFVLDGGIMLLMRHLICNNFVGQFNYFTMNLYGRILRCCLTLHKERHDVCIFNRTYKSATKIVTQQFFNDELQDVAETYMTPVGRIIIHFWHGYNYLLHSAVAPVRPKPKEHIVPMMEDVWRMDPRMIARFEEEKEKNHERNSSYLARHPELNELVQDYVNCLLTYKPTNVLEFSIKYFQSFEDF
ncbi:ciliogenesis-associated TTC17-interacting protein-like [Scaptodrosophila lebanonensis]|uniref:Ciliogenesis-associated TTC17-interacting protein-like n=1 Tax=Drosophila lebanonensis TaxID=7225 RepID=A0A6J2U910_DROLE|nr:ciliogenesis-associated TTC17-interacting protein-like [Scaptodrosophila lebanonensis]